MRLNEKNVASFAVCSSPVDKEGYLQKKGDLNREFQRRWFVLKGNLLFYFLKKQDKEPQGVIVLEACSVQVSIHGRYCFEISFDGVGTRTYVLGADNDDDMQMWMKAISHASYEYLKSIVDELQRRVNVLTSSTAPQKEAEKMETMKVGSVASKGAVAGRGSNTSVTLQDLSNPIPPLVRSSPTTSTTKIRKGILVDIDNEAPPIPVKKNQVKKSMTMHGGVVSGATGKDTYTERLLRTQEGPDEESTDQGKALSPHAPLSLVKSFPSGSTPLHPRFSSPMVLQAPLQDPSKPLSPPSTLDRTPILQPSPAPTTSTNKTNATLDTALNRLSRDKEGSQSPQSSSPRQNGGPGRTGAVLPSTEPSSHPPQVPRKLAAPLDPSKTFIEMHEDFTQAMKALNAERTGNAGHPPS